MIVGEDPHLVVLARIERDHRPASHAEELLDRHLRPAQQDRDFHFHRTDLTHVALQDLRNITASLMFGQYGFRSVKT
ncbi:hypothetical protein MACH15_08510 [Maricaulis maris]|nr:hypothetical protein MACH15_08510 [Maricaulis maris]